jgi:hypothetical protein
MKFSPDPSHFVRPGRPHLSQTVFVEQLFLRVLRASPCAALPRLRADVTLFAASAKTARQRRFFRSLGYATVSNYLAYPATRDPAYPVLTIVRNVYPSRTFRREISNYARDRISVSIPYI